MGEGGFWLLLLGSHQQGRAEALRNEPEAPETLAVTRRVSPHGHISTLVTTVTLELQRAGPSASPATRTWVCSPRHLPDRHSWRSVPAGVRRAHGRRLWASTSRQSWDRPMAGKWGQGGSELGADVGGVRSTRLGEGT